MFSFEFEHLNIFSAIFPSFFNLQNIVTIYLQDLHKEHRLYEYNNTKDAMEKIPSHFYKDFRLQITARPLGKYGTKMADRNKKRSTSTVLLKNRGQ